MLARSDDSAPQMYSELAQILKPKSKQPVDLLADTLIDDELVASDDTLAMPIL